MRFIIALGLLMFLFVDINAQSTKYGTIDGYLIDNATKQPVLNALISIRELKINTITDSTGYFKLINVNEGVYTLEVKHVAFEKKQIDYVIVLENKNTYQEIEINEIANDSKEVVVVANKFENNRSSPVSLYTFSREEIALNPGSQGDIFRAIGMLPGVSSSGGIYSAIAVRGQGVRDNVYIVDDIPLTEVGHLEGNSFFNDPNGGRFSIFAPRVIDNAQFIGGGFSSEFGRRSASFLGLNIKEGNLSNPIVDGQIDLLGITVNYDGPSKLIKNTSVFVSARYQNFYGLVNLIGLKDIGLPAYGDFIVKTTTNINNKNKLSILGIVSPESYVRDINNVYADEKLNLLYLPNFKRNKIVVGINLRTLLSKKSYLKNIVYYTSYSSNISVGKAFPVLDTSGKLVNETIDYINNLQQQNYNESKFGLRSLYNYTFNKWNKINAGIEFDILALRNERKLNYPDTEFIYRTHDINNTNMKYKIILPEHVNAKFNSSGVNISAFANYSVQINERLSINTGFRIDYTGFLSQIVIAPRISGSYSISKNSSINFAWGIYYQDPVYSDIADQAANKVLKMEKVTHYIIGYKRYFQPSLKLTVEAWYKKFDDLIVTPTILNTEKNNNGSGYGKGIDVSIIKKLTNNIHGQISYSYIECKRDDGDNTGNYDFMYSQPNQLNFLLSYKYNTKLSFSLKYRYATGKPVDDYIINSDVFNNVNNLRYSKEIIGRNASRLPYFSSLDVRINYDFKVNKTRLTIFLDIVNVLNRQIANNENFNSITGKSYYDGLAIFPTGGLKFIL